MRAALIATLFASTCVALDAAAACAAMRVGVVDQNRPPFFIGAGSVVPTRPGATVDLLREAGASAACPVTVLRMPALRLRGALTSGTIDAMLLDATDADTSVLALPTTPDGKLDPGRGLPMFTVVFVRVADHLPADTDPANYFATRALGVNNGASVANQLRKLGYHVDDGALDARRNLEKLMRHRIDGYVAVTVEPANADRMVGAIYGTQLQRLEKPLRVHHFWLAFNQGYAAANREPVQAIWSWLGARGHARFVELIRTYETAD